MSENVVTKQMLEDSIAAYQQQLDELSAGLKQLEQNYAEQKHVVEHTSAMIEGAIGALDQLIANLTEETHG